MTFVPAMWTVWGVLVFLMAALHIYRSSLSRDEEDQIFLDDSFEQEKSAQEVIVTKIKKVEPVLRVLQWLSAAMTLFIIAYYIRDFLLSFHIIGQ
jgi:hypothetical protein